MTPDECRETYRNFMEEVGEEIIIRRYFGTGMNRNKFEVKVIGRVMGYEASELIGTVIQGDRKLIVLVDDLETGQFPIPVVKNDKVFVRGKEINVESSDDNTRRINGELIAYVIQARG